MSSAALKEVQLPISGMTCAACATRIEKGLNKMEGVESANVNLALEKASIMYNPEVTEVADFEKRFMTLDMMLLKKRPNLI